MAEIESIQVQQLPHSRDPFAVPELLRMAIGHLDSPKDVLACACVNTTWYYVAIERLYEGSDINMRFRTPPIEVITRLMRANRKHFAFLFTHVKHLKLEATHTKAGWKKFWPNVDANSLQSTSSWCAPLHRKRDTHRMLGTDGQTQRTVPLKSLTMFSGLLRHLDHKTLVRLLNFEILHLIMDFAVFQRVSQLIKPIRLPRLHATLKRLTLSITKDVCESVASVKRFLRHLSLDTLRIEPADPMFAYQGKFIRDLARSVRFQPGLKALALSMQGAISGPANNHSSPYPRQKFPPIIFPSLLVLVCQYPTTGQMIDVSECTNLQMLRTVGIAHGHAWSLIHFGYSLATDLPRDLIKLTQLKVLHLNDGRLQPSEVIYIARACPQLEAFSILSPDEFDSQNHCFTEEELLQLAKLLPNICLLALDFFMPLTSKTFMQIPELFPKLSFLSLLRARVCFSLRNLQRMPRLSQLRLLDVQCIYFAGRFMEGGILMRIHLNMLKDAWRKAFPSLTYQPTRERGYGNTQGAADMKEKRTWTTLIDDVMFDMPHALSVHNAQATPYKREWLTDAEQAQEASKINNLMFSMTQLPMQGHEVRKFLWKELGYREHGGSAAETFWARYEAQVMGRPFTQPRLLDIRYPRGSNDED